MCNEVYHDGTHTHACIVEHVAEASLKLHVCRCGKDWNYVIQTISSRAKLRSSTLLAAARRALPYLEDRVGRPRDRYEAIAYDELADAIAEAEKEHE